METPGAVPAPRVGCVYRPQFPPERLAEAARVADESGVDELWLWEDCFLSGGLTSAAIALSHSSGLTVGIGVLPVPLRNVALTAMEIATLARAFPGRLRVGVGHGVQDWMAQVGEKVSSPLTLMREYLSALSGLLDGQTVTVKGRYVVLDGVALDWPPDAHVDLLAAATGPKTLRLSGELAKGTVISGGTTPSALRDAVAHIRAGTALRDTSSPHSVTTYLPCATGPDARRRATADLDSQADANGHVAAYGTAKEIAAAARLWVDAGADTIVFQPPADEDFVRFTSFIGSEVRGLLAC